MPTSEKIFVPLLFFVPMPEYHSPPLSTMHGMFAQVSTLLMFVGQPQRPLCAGYGGRGRGRPSLPSIAAMSAVSAPQTNAPPPLTTLTLKSKSDPRMSLPRRP